MYNVALTFIVVGEREKIFVFGKVFFSDFKFVCKVFVEVLVQK